MSVETVVIRNGTWLYDGSVTCTVHVERRSFSPGSGDYEDPPEVREDREGSFFFACYHSPLEPARVLSEVGPFDSLADAVEHVAANTQGTLRWGS
jgi:hypothetical protein